MSSSISISAKFSIPSSDESETIVVEKKFDESNCEPARLGLPPGVEAVKPQGGDYSYSGMHDHGPLPAPKEGGDFAKLIGMVNEARKHSDEMLTKVIREQNAATLEQKKKRKQRFDELHKSSSNKSADGREKIIRQKVNDKT